jgi:hypothetical protein
VGKNVDDEIVRDTTTMLDTTPVTTEITRLIASGTTEQALLAAVSYLFPNLSSSRAQRGVARSNGRGGAAGQQKALLP